MRGAHLIAMLVFTFFAALQFNDPDPLRWVFAYGFTALIAGLAALGLNVFLPSLGGMVVFLLWGAQWIPSMNVQGLAPEETREALGLSISAAWLAVAFVGSLQHVARCNLAGRPRPARIGLGGNG